ncbi:MAG: ABC transporter ATP-binding protein [Armatimonadetes bacterium]|nr:ABC transporter ATP-binding protein [Armatimonadota bacterium]
MRNAERELTMVGESLLQVVDLEAGYGGKRVVNGVSLGVARGEIVALLGPNGAGKSTLLKATFGLVAPTGGQVVFDGREMTGAPASGRVRLGMGYVPQGSRVFGELTVAENLEVGGHSLGDRRAARNRQAQVLTLFPALGELQRRLAGTLSGGEQQMVSLARALMTNPSLLLVDEPSLGLGPGAAQSALEHLQTLARDSGTAILLVEQNVSHALRLAHRVIVLVLGRVVLEAEADSLTERDLRQAFFGQEGRRVT